jgi:uncharacterized RDD family membrane protein YckC
MAGQDRRDLTPGDPLGEPERPAPAERPAPERPPPAERPAPERPAPPATRHYGGGRVPPGAFAPRAPRPGPPAREELASWGSRAVATLVDGLIVGGVTLLILAGLGVGFFADGTVGALEVFVGLLVGSLIFAVLALLYAPLIMARTNGQTLGKMLAGCRVVRADGQRVGFWWAALREVAVKGVLLGVAASLTGGIAYLVDVLWPLPDPENRALHDYVVDSRVVHS